MYSIIFLSVVSYYFPCEFCILLFSLSFVSSYPIIFPEFCILLFIAEEAESGGYTSSLNIGVIPDKVMSQILPPYITKECLISLQYCHQIDHSDIKYFSSISSSDSSNQPKHFLFFPALCSADKSEGLWNAPEKSDYSIGWLAQLTDPDGFFPPRFLHVLLLRIVFRFALPPPSSEVPIEAQTSSASLAGRYSGRRCAMWKNGVHWKMENGVECMMELVDTNKGVVVMTKSRKEREDNCIRSFTDIISCVMEAKALFQTSFLSS